MSSAPSNRDELSAATGRWILFATILASSMAFIDGSALNVALPALQRDLNASGSEVLWVVNGYSLFLAALILVGGAAGDRYGRKRIFMAGIALFAAASLACGLASTAELLILFRAIQGIGAALMVPGSLSIISASFHDRRRGQAIGTWSAFSTVTTVIGPLLGGFLASAGLWRGIFFVNLPLAGLALAALHWKVPESRDPGAPERLDWWGAIAGTAALAALTFGFIRASERGFSEPLIIAAIVGGLLAMGLFLWIEWRVAQPLVPLSLFDSPAFSTTNLLTLTLYAALSATTFFLSLNMVQIQDYDEKIAGLATVPFALLLALISRWSGSYADEHGPWLPLTVGPAITALSFLLFARIGVTGGPSAYWSTFFPGFVALGIGMGITVAPLTSTVMGAAPDEESGTASGINNAISRGAGVLAIAILGALALNTFGGSLLERARPLDLSEPALSALRQEVPRFGDSAVPEEVAAPNRAAVERAIDLAFVSAFRRVALISAALAMLSALVAARFLRRDSRADTL